MQIYGIKCDVEQSSGVTLGWWVATLATAELLNNKGKIVLYGYASKAAYEAGKPYQVCVDKELSDISSLSSFDAVWQECCGALIAQHFVGGNIEQAIVPGSELTTNEIA